MVNGIPDEERVSRLIHLEIEPLIEMIEPDEEGKKYDDRYSEYHPIFFQENDIFFHRMIHYEYTHITTIFMPP
jgi:hypothetical protein